MPEGRNQLFKVRNPLDTTERKKRLAIRASVKQAVFNRADGKCEYRGCKKSLKWGNKGSGATRGVFHHTRSPSISPTEKTVRFVCPDHHDHLHEYKTRKKSLLLTGETIKSRRTVRKDTKPKRKSTRKRRKTPRSSYPDFTKLI
jgi:hypothetical protein